MPRNPRYKHYIREQIVAEKNSAPYLMSEYSENNFSHRCQHCNHLLSITNSKSDQYCRICRKRSKPIWKKCLIPVPQFNPQSDEANANISHSNANYNSMPRGRMSLEPHPRFYRQSYERNPHSDTLIYNNYPNEETVSRVDNTTWDRRIYPTPTEISQDFNRNNTSHEFFSNRSVRLKPKVEYQAETSYFQKTENYHENSSIYSSSSYTYSTGKNKRKLEVDYTPQKKRKEDANYILPSFSELSKNIWDHYAENCQTNQNYSTKMALRSKLQKVIERKFAGCDLFVFGSSMTGFAAKTSDIDMCLMFHDLEVRKGRVVGLLWELRSLLSKLGYLWGFQVIRAKVPILKFKDKLSGFDIDLNINNPTGIRNSQLLRSYARLDDRIRPLILATKFWARYHNINDAKSGTLSSYSLGLMIIHYLQYRCSPPVLPSLQILQPNKFLADADVRTLKIDEDLPSFRSENGQTLGQLFVGFLNYYSKEFDFKNSRISVRLGQTLPREDKILNKTKELRHWIDIEEPFEKTNTARSVHTPQTANLIKSVFDKSYYLVMEQGTLGNV